MGMNYFRENSKLIVFNLKIIIIRNIDDDDDVVDGNDFRGHSKKQKALNFDMLFKHYYLIFVQEKFPRSKL